MALDGIFLQSICLELQAEKDHFIDRIFQPSKEELVLVFRGKSGGSRWLFSAHANAARVHRTHSSPQNPKSPPMFCMLMRKHLIGAKLLKVWQQELDRILFLEFKTHNRLGDVVPMRMAVELMGRHSNIILIDKDGKILDAIKRVPQELSSVRPISPGINYKLPPGQSKYNLLSEESEALNSLISLADVGDTPSWLTKNLQGISTLAAREFEGESIKNAVLNIKNKLHSHDFSYCMLTQNNKPVKYSWLDICQYGSCYEKKFFNSASELLDAFYEERALQDRIRQKSSALQKSLESAILRTGKKLQVRKAEWDNTARRDEYRKYGDLLNANLYRLKKGDVSATLEDFETNNKVEIPLDPKKTPAQNAQKYYQEYKKSVRARSVLSELMAEAQDELSYLESELDLLERARRLEDIEEIQAELSHQGVLKKSTSLKKKAKVKPLPPYQYRSSDGFLILCGRNNQQNDKLTLKQAGKKDIWFHTQKIHGSHVILFTEGKEVPEQSLMEAAIIAACHSKGKDSAQVPVDMTEVKYVKKPPGAKPGMVIFTNQKTVYVKPDEKTIKKLQEAKDEKGTQ